MRSLTLIVPVLNEILLVHKFLAKTVSDLDREHLDWEMILVDDGSTDGTREVMQDYARDRPRIHVLALPENLGPGANLIEAYQMATKEFSTCATVDGFYDTALLPGLIAQLNEGYDGLSAYRTDLSGHPPLRRVQTMINVYLQRAIFPRYRFEAYHTLQIHRTDFAQKSVLEARSPFLCSEMLFKAIEYGLRIKEVGIPYLPREAGKATGGSPKLITNHLKEVAKFWIRWNVLRRPLTRPGVSFAPLPPLPQTSPQVPGRRQPASQEAS
jgi:glycosyltransferase involved in cell wall biosynthesis